MLTPPDLVARLSAADLASALVARLVADDSAELAAALVDLLASRGLVLGGPGNPHKAVDA